MQAMKAKVMICWTKFETPAASIAFFAEEMYPKLINEGLNLRDSFLAVRSQSGGGGPKFRQLGVRFLHDGKTDQTTHNIVIKK